MGIRNISRGCGGAKSLARGVTVAGFAIFSLACTRRANDLVTVRTATGRSLSLPRAETLRIASTLHELNWQIGDHLSLDNIMEGLIQYDFSSGQIKLRPALAESWRSSAAHRRWTFTLRRNVRWTDGVEFTGAHLVDAWRRLLSPELASPVAYFLFGIKNARAYHEGKVPFEKVGITLKNGRELDVELERPLAFFPSLLTNASTFPIRLDQIGAHGADWFKPEHLVTLGPYRAVDLNLERHLVLRRNDTYYDAESIRGAPENVVLYNVTDEAERDLFQGGQLDVRFVPLQMERSLSDGPGVHREPGLTLEYLGFGTKRKPFDDPRVRRAVALALDRDQASAVVGGGQNPLPGWGPGSLLGRNIVSKSVHSVTLAKALLKAAGLEGQAPFRIELALYREDDKTLAEAIQFQLKRAFGWEVEVTAHDWATLKGRFTSDPPGMFLHGWNLDFPDPDNVYNLLTSFSGNNHTGWKSLEFDALVERAAGAATPAARVALYEAAQKILLERDVPAVPIYSMNFTTQTADRVKAYAYNALGKMILKSVRLETTASAGISATGLSRAPR